MSNNQRVKNLTRGGTLKHGQVVRGVQKCALAWVEFGVSFRQLTAAESIAARHAQKKQSEPLPLAEIPHIVFKAPERAQTSTRQEMHMAMQAVQFAASVA